MFLSRYISNIGHLKSENDGPDETKSETWAAIHDIMGTHVLKVHFLFM